MRLIGLILALGAIMWVMYQAAGGDDAETMVPVEYQKSVEKAKSVEQTLQDAAQRQLQELDNAQPEP